MYVATCKPQTNFQGRFTISVELSFQVFFPRQYQKLRFDMTRILLRITSDLPSPAPQSTGFKNIQFSGYFVFFPTPFGSREVFSLPPALAITVYTYCRSYCSASAIHLTLLSQQQYSLAPGSLTKFFNLLNQQHYLIAPGLLYVFFL